MSGTAGPLPPEVGDYLEMLAAERGAGANTIDAYRRDLSDYLAYLARAGLSVEDVDTATLRGFVADLETRGLSPSTAARRLSCVRGFHKFLYAEGAAETDPSAPVSGPRKGRPLPKVLSVAEVDRLLAGAQQAAACPTKPPAPPGGRGGWPACSNCSTPRACASRNSWPCPAPPPASTRGSSW